MLLGVSYLESRWEDHDGAVSASGGYGPMHLTRSDLGRPTGLQMAGKGEQDSRTPATTGTLNRAVQVTGIAERRLRSDAVANICGGAAVLASYQEGTVDRSPAAWSKAVALYSGAADEQTALRFVRQAFSVIRAGESRTTADGSRVTLAPRQQARVDVAAVQEAGLLEPGLTEADCPPALGCEVIEAPYEWYGAPDPGAYGNHDLVDRPHDLSIDYIVIHNTEGNWERALELVTDPEYVSWQYTLRSADGHIAQHVDNRQVAWHAGNWYVNMHSIRLEHEGVAARGAKWFTEEMYRTSARLVRRLRKKYDIPRDRAHIIGHDQIPGTTTPTIPGMHWDTGPFWDWEHYMRLIKAPIERDRHRTNLVTVAPGFEDNQQVVTDCKPGWVCRPQGTNFVYLHTQPNKRAPLVQDIGLRPDGSFSTRQVSDIGARAAAGHEFKVVGRKGRWLKVWWLGEEAWLKNPLGALWWSRPAARWWCPRASRRCRSTAGPTRRSRPTGRRSRTRRSRRCRTPSSRGRTTPWPTGGCRPTTTTPRPSTTRCRATTPSSAVSSATTRSGSVTGWATCRPTTYG